MEIKKMICFLFFIISINLFSQKFINVADVAQYNEAIKNATPGTTIILQNGLWEDVSLKAYGKGTKENPITIRAKNAGKVILSGDSNLTIYGEYIVVEGLWFKDGSPTSKTLVSFKNGSKEFANNCRFTNNAITNFNPNYHAFKTNWIGLWGKNNRIDHNYFTGKTNDGTTLVVWLKGVEHLLNNHRIDSNLFGPRPDLGRKSAEIIRIGTTKYSMEASETIVENNTFHKCDGGLEIISNKSGNNIFRNNLFLESKGTLSLRHGNNALVENNVFMGNNKSHTGGIRIINKGHTIRNNLLIGLKGKGNRSALSFLNGIPNSPLNRYHQVEGVDVQNNTIIDCGPIEFTLGKNEEKTLPPINTVFANNLIGKSKKTISKATDDITGITFKNNIVQTSGDFDQKIFSNKSINWKDLKKIPIPTGNNESLVSDFKNDNTPLEDITGAVRTSLAVGAFNLDTSALPIALELNSGTSWDVNITTKKFKGRTITIEPGEGTLNKAINGVSGQTMLKLRDGVYFLSKKVIINQDVTIKGNKNTIIKSQENLKKSFTSFFKVDEGSKLTLKNVTLDGEINTIKYAIVSPSKDGSEPYDLFIDNCVFKNFRQKNGGYLIKGYRNTVADTISIKNSQFLDSYRGLTFSSKENEVLNVHNFLIDNTVFKNIEGIAIKVVKTDGVDPDKGNLVITNSVFSNINNIQGGRMLEIKKIPLVEIKNSVFQESEKIFNPVSLSGSGNAITNSLVYNCGEIKTSKGAIQKNIVEKRPKWKDKENFTPNKRSPLLKKNNKIGHIGLKQ